jgi:hypothetical protein
MVIDELFQEVYENSFVVSRLILEGSTPVISFGDFTKSSIATLGINPSPLEFVNRRGQILNSSEKRLADLESLALGPEDFLLSRNKVEEIWRGCQLYFQENRNPYWGWFDILEQLLNSIGISYKTNAACHLDLAPIATKDVYSKLSMSDKFILVTNFRRTLEKQLRASKIKTVIFNGRTVFETLQFVQNVDWKPLELVNYKCNGRSLTSSLHAGEAETGQRYLGWTVNLQSFRGNKKERQELLLQLSEWVKRNSQ